MKLTPRERDVLRLLADGHSNESIGRALFISPDTARTQLGVAMAKLGLRPAPRPSRSPPAKS